MNPDPAVQAGVQAARDAIRGGYQGRTYEHLVQIGIETAWPLIAAQIADFVAATDDRVAEQIRDRFVRESSP